MRERAFFLPVRARRVPAISTFDQAQPVAGRRRLASRATRERV